MIWWVISAGWVAVGVGSVVWLLRLPRKLKGGH